MDEKYGLSCSIASLIHAQLNPASATYDVTFHDLPPSIHCAARGFAQKLVIGLMFPFQ
jgi:hypothetical protein